MKLSYERDMAHNFMVPEIPEEVMVEDYQIQMLAENDIPGLLHCRMKRINGKVSYYYDITSLQTMTDLFEKSPMKSSDIKRFVEGLQEALSETERYLLDADHLMLEPQMIFMDVEDRKPLFCYLPTVNMPIREAFAKLSGYVLEHLEQTDPTAVLMGYQMYRQARNESTSVGKLLKELLFYQADSGSEEQDTGRTDRKKEIHTITEKEGARENKTAVLGKNEGGYGRNRDMTDVDSGFTGKKESNEVTGIRPEKLGDHTGRDENSREAEKKSGRENSKRKVLLCLLTAAALMLIAAGIWYWHLSITQLGGLTFLVTAALGYAFSLEVRNSGKERDDLQSKERRADRKSLRELRRNSGKVYAQELSTFPENLVQNDRDSDFRQYREYSVQNSVNRGTHHDRCTKTEYESSQRPDPDCSQRPDMVFCQQSDTAVYQQSDAAVYQRSDVRRYRWSDMGSSHPSDMEANVESERSAVRNPVGNTDERRMVQDRRKSGESREIGRNSAANAGNERKRGSTAGQRGRDVSGFGISQEYPDDRECASQSNRYASKSGKYEYVRDSALGTTTVLQQGSTEYRPELALISMNPKERNSIVLLNSCYTVGKLKSRSDICIDDPSISRVHARIERDGKAYYLRDMNSTNGTSINGRQLKVNERCLLKEGDEIRFAGLGYYIGRC